MTELGAPKAALILMKADGSLTSNFVRPATTPIVFHSLVSDTLFHGGTHNSERLAISGDSGKWYCRIAQGGTAETRGGGANNNRGMECGLISTSVGVALSGKITIDYVDGAEKFRDKNDMEINWLSCDFKPGECSC